MEDHPILPGGMGPLVDAMETLIQGRPELEPRVAGHSLQRAVQGDGAPRFQRTAKRPNLM